MATCTLAGGTVTAVATVPVTVSLQEEMSTGVCSLELNSHGDCSNVNNKQTPLAKVSKCSSVKPEIGQFMWLK